MQVKTIYPPTQIFDDPKYCGKLRDMCRSFERFDGGDHDDSACCNAFFDGNGDSVDIIEDHIGWAKCDECKKYYNGD